MPYGSQLTDLHPSAYEPYRDPRDYILSWTDAIWIDRGLGRLTEHYDKQVKVHTAYGETYDWDFVVNNSLQKFSAFPNGGGGYGEDVIWESRGPNAFISSHRVFKSGTHTGYWTYGAPTGKHWVSRTVAHCLVTDNKVNEEWLVRDEWAVLERLGLDPYKVAAELAESSPVLGKAMALSSDQGAFAGTIGNAALEGVSGKRPNRYLAECAVVQGIFDEVWNRGSSTACLPISTGRSCARRRACAVSRASIPTRSSWSTCSPASRISRSRSGISPCSKGRSWACASRCSGCCAAPIAACRPMAPSRARP